MKPSNDLIDLKIDPDFLADNATLVETQTVQVHFSDEEKIELKEELFQLVSKKQLRDEVTQMTKDILEANELNVAEEIEALSERIKSIDYGEIGLKMLKKQIPELTRKINSGYDMVDAKLYGFDHQEINRMAFYNEDGAFVYDRPLTQMEKQTTIFTTHKNASNGTNG